MHKTLSLPTLIAVGFLGMSMFAQTPSARSKESIYVGILDDAREEMVNWKPGVAQERIVRPLFKKAPERWTMLDGNSLPTRMSWTVGFDGRNLGTVETEAGTEGFTPIQKILTPKSAISTVGVPSGQFSGLLGGGGETKVRRPLVAVSRPYVQDPDGWKRTRLPNEIAVLVRAAFRHDYPQVDRCKDEEIVERNWKFPDSVLSFPVAYGSNKHSFLVQSELNAGNCGYISEPDEPKSEPWFSVSSDGSVRRIGSFLTLLDAGDYDNDGRSEVVFLISQGENTDGFVLFDSAFGKPVTVTWDYH